MSAKQGPANQIDLNTVRKKCCIKCISWNVPIISKFSFIFKSAECHPNSGIT